MIGLVDVENYSKERQANVGVTRPTRGADRNPDWGHYLKARRRAVGMTGAQLSAAAGINPTYVSLIENNGLVPSRSKVLAIGQALGCVDAILLHAGYAPEQAPELVLRCLSGPALEGLTEPLRAQILRCLHKSAEEQAVLAELLAAALNLGKDHSPPDVRDGQSTGKCSTLPRVSNPALIEKLVENDPTVATVSRV